jgi:hypothetical protein
LLDPSPGQELSCSWPSPPVSWTTLEAGVASRAARAAQDCTQTSLCTPRKRKGPEAPASSQKQRMTVDSARCSKSKDMPMVLATVRTTVIGSPPGNMADWGHLDPQVHKLPETLVHSEAAEHGAIVAEPGAHDAPTSVQRSHGSSEAPSAMVKRNYTKRGTAGTFQGKRPPKDPCKLNMLLIAKAAYEKENMEREKENETTTKMRRVTPTQEQYRAWQRTFDRSKASSARVAFVTAAAEWQKQKAKQVEQDDIFF